MIFKDRQEAGKMLVQCLTNYKDENMVILALPRGGLPVGEEIAKGLNRPLDVIIARKIGAPGNPEFAIGALSECEVQILDQDTISQIKIDKKTLDEIIKKEKEELKRRIDLYRDGKQLPSLQEKTVILTDDGLATGMTASAAIKAVKKLNPKKIIFALPVCAKAAKKELLSWVDKLICLQTPGRFAAVGSWYKNFEQISDQQVLDILKRNKGLLTKDFKQ